MKKPLRVLIVEDNSADAALILRELRQAGFEPDWQCVDTEVDFCASLHPELEIILSDFTMPQFSGLRALAMLHESNLDIPFILISGTVGEDAAVEAMQRGATDYLLKDRLARLGSAVERALREAHDRRERKAVEEQATLQSRALEASANAILITDRQGKILSANPAFCTLTGYALEEVLGQNPRLLKSGTHDAAFYRQLWETVSAGQIWRGELTNRRKDGTLYDEEMTITPVRAATGAITHFIAIKQDTTERKRAEEALRASDERFRSFMAHSPAAGWIVDREGCLRYLSPGYYRLFGVETDRTGERISDICEPALAEVYLANNRRALDGACAIEVVELARRADGSLGEFLVVKFPIEVPGGESLLGGIALDITERKRTEERMRRLVESNVQGVFFWKANGAIAEANDAFLHLTGYTRDDLAAGLLNSYAMTPPEFAEADRHATEQLLRGGVCDPFEKEYVRNDGTRVPVLLGAACFVDNPEEGVCYAVDLTERKKLEQQFLRSQRMESIGTLAGGIAHDLNNALGPIIMSLDLLKMKFTDPASQELLAIITTSAQHGADMVRQVLSFARGVEGRRMEVQIRHLVQDIEKITNDTFLKNIQVRTIIPFDLWTVLGDPTQLHQVLLNLCVNARDAMPQGGTLTVSAGNRTLDVHYAGLNLEAKPGPYVFLQVEDTGTGIPSEVIDKIFDPFFTTKKVGEGTGLGLSTSLAIVKSHGGYIRVSSELGQGTKFKVYLPAQTETSPAAAAELTEMPRGHGELILVVDDEASVRQITQQTLEAFGYRVLLAVDGADAVALFGRRQKEIAAVLTDMMMPVLDGPATIQVLRKMNPAVPIIAASGLFDRGHVAQADSLSVKHFLRKPYTAETLLKALKQVLTAA